jgi:hypothetical protein
MPFPQKDREMLPTTLKRTKFFVLGALAFSTAGCAGDLNPMRDVFVATGIGGAPRERPDFVEETRPENLEYIPVGTAAATRETAPKTVEEIAQMEEELRRLQTANEARATQARRLALSPAPAPVVVEPIPELSPAPEPVTSIRTN